MKDTARAAVGYEVVSTRSGARAMRDLASGEVMHPGTGPAIEAQTVYVRPSRLEHRLREGGAPLVVMDVGLGAASNAIAAWCVSETLPASARRLEIISFENDLTPLHLALRVEHAQAFGLVDGAYSAAKALVTDGVVETARSVWRLKLGDFRACIVTEPDASTDVVFWDMFSSGSAPELWTAAVFSQVRRACRDGATLHTYSSATATRSALLLGGFSVGIGDSTGERTETTVAATRVTDLAQPLGDRWLERLSRSSSPFPIDVPPSAAGRADAMLRVQSCTQFAQDVD